MHMNLNSKDINFQNNIPLLDSLFDLNWKGIPEVYSFVQRSEGGDCGDFVLNLNEEFCE